MTERLFVDDRRFLFGPWADVATFLLPTLVAFAWTVGAPDGQVSEFEWVAWVLLVDVAHVWSTLARVYADAAAFAERPRFYAALPALVFLAVLAVYGLGERVFAHALAYFATFHFVRQQAGFVALALGRSGAPAPVRRIGEAAVYVVTGLPLAHWHLGGRRHFGWMEPGDYFTADLSFAHAGAPLAWFVFALAMAVAFAFAARMWRTQRDGGSPTAGLVVVSTALAWGGGILLVDGDRLFSATNVLPHGVAYFVLLHRYARARGHARGRGATGTVLRAAAFVLPFVLLATIEEGLISRWLTGEHAQLFGAPSPAPPAMLPFVVALLAVPQVTHYVLDGVVWRAGTSASLRAAMGAPEGRPA